MLLNRDPGRRSRVTCRPGDELKLLSRLPAEALVRINREATAAEYDFQVQAMGNHLMEHGDDYNTGTVERKKYELMGMCNRLAHRELLAHFKELKALPIAAGSVRRLLYFVLVDVTIRLFREKWQDYIPPEADDSEEDFVLAAIDYQKPLIEQYYAEALEIQQERLATSVPGKRKQDSWPPAAVQ